MPYCVLKIMDIQYISHDEIFPHSELLRQVANTIHAVTNVPLLLGLHNSNTVLSHNNVRNLDSNKTQMNIAW